jgi:hypothetical protein
LVFVGLVCRARVSCLIFFSLWCPDYVSGTCSCAQRRAVPVWFAQPHRPVAGSVSCLHSCSFRRADDSCAGFNPSLLVDFPEWTVLQFLLSFSPSWISIPRCATESILVPHPLLSPGSGACRAATIPGSSCDDAVFFSLSPYAKSVAFVLLLVSSVAA